MIEYILSFFFFIGIFFHSIVPCFVLEKAFSLLQGRKFNIKFAWAMWMIAFFAPGLIGNFASNIGKIYEQKDLSYKEKLELHKKGYNSS